MAKENSYDPKEHNKNLDKLRAEFGTKVTDADSMSVKPRTMEDITGCISEAPKPLFVTGPLDMPKAKSPKKDENKLQGGKAKSMEQHKNCNY